MNELVKLDKIAIGSPKSVPAGEYAMEAFKKAALDKPLERKLVMARDVRECLMYAEGGKWMALLSIRPMRCCQKR